MALYLQHKTEGVQWAVWKMEEPLNALLSLLPEGWRIACERELNRFVSERRKLEWTSVRVLLYTMLREEKEITYSSENKPYLSDCSFFISISHTKEYVAVILSTRSAVGIDIEQYGQRVHRVADRYMRSDEQAAAYRGDTTWSLLLHWSAKEAVFKRMEDADADLRKLRLTHFVPQEEGTFQVREFATELQRTYEIGYRVHPDFVLTWTLN
ncbi:4'-phosphopantetheinyl transferase family protein [uncultured Bacteroides sp.]|uniref:4'-phosphopantetheinyl transferase family protein n=1 Tax=uncultured Bacteroides sp. TaxID=162156 RepID=UPI0025E05AC3|nr:4'-phosphopantetheinyl transferase family protein [uncultured Bacteroides sp.]